MTNKHRGSTFESFLEEDGILEEVNERATRRLIARQIKREMQRQKVSRSEMAERMQTSRNQVNRLIGDADEDVRLSTILRAAHALSREVEINLV